MATWKGIVGRSFTPEEFRNYIAGLTFPTWRPQFVVLHNTAVPRLSEWHSVPGLQRMANLESYYRDVQHWSAGPHLFIADDLIWVFTPLTAPGVHAPSWNAISWGVELVGDYTVEPFAAAVRNNAIAALVSLHALLGLDPATLRFHKEDPKTTHKDCPGRKVVKTSIIRSISEAMADAHPGEHLPAAFGKALGTSG